MEQDGWREFAPRGCWTPEPPRIIAPKDAPTLLGDLKRDQYHLIVHCRDPQCWRNLGLDLDRAIERFGADAELSKTIARVVCAKCKGRDIHWYVREPYVPLPGLAHINPPGELSQRMADREPVLDRYRRLAGESVMTTSPDAMLGIDDPARPPREYRRPRGKVHRVLRLLLDRETGLYAWQVRLRRLGEWAKARTANGNSGGDRG